MPQNKKMVVVFDFSHKQVAELLANKKAWKNACESLKKHTEQNGDEVHFALISTGKTYTGPIRQQYKAIDILSDYLYVYDKPSNKRRLVNYGTNTYQIDYHDCVRTENIVNGFYQSQRFNETIFSSVIFHHDRIAMLKRLALMFGIPAEHYKNIYYVTGRDYQLNANRFNHLFFPDFIKNPVVTINHTCLAASATAQIMKQLHAAEIETVEAAANNSDNDPDMPDSIAPSVAEYVLNAADEENNKIVNAEPDNTGLLAMLTTEAPIDQDDFVWSTEIGKGSYGSVYEGTYQNKTVAIKSIRLVATPNEIARVSKGKDPLQVAIKLNASKLAAAKQERYLHAHLSHAIPAYVVSYYGYHHIFAAANYRIIMEHMDLGNAADCFLKPNAEYHYPGNFNITPAIQQAAVVKMIHCLFALHSLDVLHRDIKLENFLVNASTIKLADFGLSNYDTNRTDTISTEFLRLRTESRGAMAGTPIYIAPEVLQREIPHSKKSDMYSLGFCMWSVLSGGNWDNYLLDVNSMPELVKAIGPEMRRPPIDNSFPPVIAVWLKRVWDSNPENRPLASDLEREIDSNKMEVPDVRFSFTGTYK